jgi:ribosomal protein S12 methylthiotransferase
MKSKTLKQNKVNIITLGCSKNLVDSEMLSGQLVANDIDVVHENKKLDHNISIINTCGFIDKAKEEGACGAIAQKSSNGQDQKQLFMSIYSLR